MAPAPGRTSAPARVGDAMVTASMADAWLEGECRGPIPLTVLYDQRCPLCRKLKAWLAGEATLVPVTFVAAGSPDARRRFPALDHDRTITVLTVVAADGAVYEGERAWLICAWSLPSWRPLAERLASRTGLPLARALARTVDRYRHRLIARSYRDSCDQCRIAAPSAPPPPPGYAR